jgi:ABC-type antimicrobial peptide transport system permease subunit
MTALEVRTSADAASLVRSVAQTVQTTVPGWMLSAKTMDDVILRSIARERMVATTSVSFATLGLMLAAFGLFGVAAFAVAERTSELGLRIAIGARPRDVIRESIGGTVWLVGAGVMMVVAVIACIVPALRATRIDPLTAIRSE